MAAIQRKNLDQPDDVRAFPKLVVHLVQVGSLAVGRGVVEPGWRWSTHVRPYAGTASCQVHHVQMLLSGRFRVEMDDGETMELVPDDVADIPAGHDAWVVGDEPAVIIDFYGNIALLGLPTHAERVVTTLLMSDIVASTATAGRLGDSAWKQLLADHNRIVRGELERFRGSEVNTTGDGFLATFASAVGALRCAVAVRDAIKGTGLELRIGVHTGEVELLPNDIGGVAVHVAARIMALAGPSEILCSTLTRGLVEGSGLRFGERGSHELRGFDRPVELFVLEA